MSITKITTEQLRQMKDKEGLVIQGCGGDLQDWVDGINENLTKQGILLNNSKFIDCHTFTHNDLTCLLFPFENVELDIGKFAIWRLQTHNSFGGTWLSDFIPNHLGGFVEKKHKPDCPLIGKDGNIFNLIGIASKTLRDNGMAEQAVEMRDKVRASGSYEEALYVIGEYVNITSEDEMNEDADEDETENFAPEL